MADYDYSGEWRRDAFELTGWPAFLRKLALYGPLALLPLLAVMIGVAQAAANGDYNAKQALDWIYNNIPLRGTIDN